MKAYFWFYLEPYVMLTCKSNDCLFYNTLSGRHLLYREHPLIVSLARRLKLATNMRVIKLSAADLRGHELSDFVSRIRACFMGDLIDAGCSRAKPVLMSHRPKVQKDVQRLKRGEGRSVGEEILEYLSEVSLFINGACGENCPGCRTYHQQFLCCTCKKRSRKELSPENVSDLLNQIKGSALARLNILGGNILLYSRKSDLAQILKAHPASTTYYLHYRHLAAADEDIESLHFASASYRVMVTPPYLTGALTSALSKLPRLGPNATVVWVVQDAKDVERAQTMNATHRISRLSLKPFYNGRNMNFFRQHVFMNLENIFEAAPTQMEIYANMMINRLKFGRLMVANNGNVHAGLNAPVLGRLGKQAVIEMLCKEMSGGRTWRKIRRKVSPCQDCVLADLCPPIGTYEAVLKRNDLCHARWV